MKLFIVGVPCSGKSTVMVCLRDRFGLNALDMDDELLRFNNGTWPSSFQKKNEVLLPKVLNEVLKMEQVVLFNSYLFVSHAGQLRDGGFRILLLEVPEEEKRRRDAIRFANEGWSNIEWFDWHQSVIGKLVANGFVDQVISGNQDVRSVAEAIMHYGETAFSGRSAE